MNSEFVELITKADNNDANAQNIIHDYFFRKLYRNQIFNDEHIKFYVDGAANKKAYSTFHLAMMHLEGLGVEKNYDTFVKLLEESCDLECSEAVYTKAFLFKLHDSNSKDYVTYIKKAMKMNNSNAYLTRSIDVLNPDAEKITMYDSIESYYDQLKKKGLIAAYLSFLNESVRLENTTAMCHLGTYYKDCKEYEKAKNIWNDCCEKGNPRGYVGIGHSYRYGYDEQIDLNKAIEFYKKAVAGGIYEIYPVIGDIYLEMNDKKSAVTQYKLGMEKKDPESFCRYGDLIISKKNTTKFNKIKTIDRAIEIYLKGERLGSTICKERRYDALEEKEKLLYGKKFHKMLKNTGTYELF